MHSGCEKEPGFSEHREDPRNLLSETKKSQGHSGTFDKTGRMCGKMMSDSVTEC